MDKTKFANYPFITEQEETLLLPEIALEENVPYHENLTRRDVENLGFDPVLYADISGDLKEECSVLPVKVDGGEIHFFASNLYDGSVERFLSGLYDGGYSSLVPKARLTRKQFISALNSQMVQSADQVVVSENRMELMLGEVLDEAMKQEASDVHIVPLHGRGGMDVRFRIDGVMMPFRRDSAISLEEYVVLCNLVMNRGKMDITQKRRPQDGVMSWTYKKQAFELRIATIPVETFGQRDDLNQIQFRILRTNDRITLADLGMMEDEFNLVKEMIRQPNGIIICTGPTSSGKTTTIYAILHTMDLSSQTCYTIENPVEYQLPGANQIKVDEAAGRDYKDILKSLMRLDPDIVFVGEIRDEESALAAAQIANTGHTVYSTLHTNTAYSAPLRLMSIGIPEYLVTSNVKGLIAQRLIRKNCPNCLKVYKPDTEILDALSLPKNIKYRRSSGKVGNKICPVCGGKSSGRTGIFELLPTFKLPNWAQYATNPEELMKLSEQAGFPTLHSSALERLKQGIISPDSLAEVFVRGLSL